MITITGETYDEIFRQLPRIPHVDIAICFREAKDFGREPVTGCVVTVGRAIPREFDSYIDAAAYIAAEMEMRDMRDGIVRGGS